MLQILPVAAVGSGLRLAVLALRFLLLEEEAQGFTHRVRTMLGDERRDLGDRVAVEVVDRVELRATDAEVELSKLGDCSLFDLSSVLDLGVDRLIPIKGVVGPWPSDVGSLLAMCLVRMRDPSALARRCSSRPLIAFDDPFDVPRRAVTRPLRRLVGQAHRVAALRRAPSAIPAGPVVAGAGFGNVRRGLRGRVRGASQSNSWAPSVA